MNQLLQKHGCSNVFTIPDGLRELMADISREVFREQPVKIFDFITNYLSCLLISREHGILAVKLLEDLCDCKPSVSEHLMQIGMPSSDANDLANIIKEEISGLAMTEGKEQVREQEIVKRILRRIPLDENVITQVCQIARNAYREYWYRKRMLEQNLKVSHEEPWEIAAQHTIDLYKRTKPSFSELTRATERIQAAYRGYYVRKKMLGHLKARKQPAPQADLPGAPLDIADSRRIDLGRVVDIRGGVKTDDVNKMFKEKDSKKLGLGYDTTLTITHQYGEEYETPENRDRAPSRMMASKNMQTQLFGALPDSKPAQRVNVFTVFSETACPRKTVSETACLIKTVSETARPIKTVSETARPIKTVSETAGPIKTVSETACLIKTASETACLIKKVSETARPIKSVSETACLIKTVSETARPIKTVSETARPIKTVSETARPIKTVSETAFPTKAVTETREKVTFDPRLEIESPRATPADSDVPEDIVTDAGMDMSDVSSAPIASDPTSAPSTAPATDVEDFADASEPEGQEE